MIIMNKIALKIAYDGEKFHGSQTQPKVHTVEDEIKKGLDKIKTSFKNIKAASRTDKGVSAIGNVISLKTEFNPEKIQRALNSQTKNTWIIGTKKVPKQFNPRKQAKTKHYRYYLPNPKEKYCIKKVKEASNIFEGQQNFKNFSKSKKNNYNTTREIKKIKVKEKEIGGHKLIVLDFYGKSFLWQMIRRIVTGIRKYSKDRLTRQDLIKRLKVKKNKGIEPSSPQNLILIKIKFEKLKFKHKKAPNKIIKEKLQKKLFKNLIRLQQAEDIVNELPE